MQLTKLIKEIKVNNPNKIVTAYTDGTGSREVQVRILEPIIDQPGEKLTWVEYPKGKLDLMFWDRHDNLNFVLLDIGFQDAMEGFVKNPIESMLEAAKKYNLKPLGYYNDDGDYERIDEVDLDSNKNSFITIPNNDEDENDTGSKSWNVMYTDNPKSVKRIIPSTVYRELKKLADTFELMGKRKMYENDQEIKSYIIILRNLERHFKKYLESKIS